MPEIYGHNGSHKAIKYHKVKFIISYQLEKSEEAKTHMSHVMFFWAGEGESAYLPFGCCVIYFHPTNSTKHFSKQCVKRDGSDSCKGKSEFAWCIRLVYLLAVCQPDTQESLLGGYQPRSKL